jgi:hypothetical protein
MLILSLIFAVAAAVLYVESPSMLIYWRYPWPVYGMLVASVVCALASKRPGALRWVTVGGTALIATLFIVYTLTLSRLSPPELSVKAGDAFPEFQLPTSTGDLFSPSQIKGKKAALYIFYRGDW